MEDNKQQVARLFYGTIVHSVSKEEPFVVKKDTLLTVKGGKIATVKSGITEDEVHAVSTMTPGAELYKLRESEFLMPGMVDTHIHASQYITAGTGYNLTLLDWLNEYTFPAEVRFSDTQFATDVYNKVVKRTLKNGTTTASYFATIHVEASLILADAMAKYGQRGFVGKVCMDKESPPHYIETTSQSLADTHTFIQKMKSRYEAGGLITPCVTPRFAVTCTTELLSELAKISDEFNVPIQTHLSENRDEIKYVVENNGVKAYAELYEKTGLLTNRTILAHCVYSCDGELDMLSRHGCGISHCPNSNITLSSGLMDIRAVESHDVKVGLGKYYMSVYLKIGVVTPRALMLYIEE